LIVAIRLVLADDHPLILDGLEALFRAAGDMEVVARCRDGEEALRAVREQTPDVLVLDLAMPRMSGLETLRTMRAEGLSARVVVLTAALDDEDVLETLRLGVRGVVLKEMAPDMLVKCVRRVQGGGTWLERVSAGRALERMTRREQGRGELADQLTPRELDVVRLVVSGLRNKEIADRLAIREGTVKIHLHRVYEKLGVDSRLALAAYARDKGLA
jgi:two-component system nitrate/nitrite response regulator NarL